MPLLVPDTAIASDKAAVHPREPDTAWFVPEIKDEKRIPREGKLVVTPTRDGGKSLQGFHQSIFGPGDGASTRGSEECRHSRLLCARRERPHDHAAEGGYQFPSSCSTLAAIFGISSNL
jgi:hypothetical protein